MADNEKISFYKTILNEWLAIDRTDNDRHKLYYSTDGTSFFQLEVGGLSTLNGDVTNYTVENPHVAFGWVGKIFPKDQSFVLSIPRSNNLPVFQPTNRPLVLEFFALTDGNEVSWCLYPGKWSVRFLDPIKL